MRESEANMLRATDRSQESGEGRREYLEVRKRIHEGEEVAGVAREILEMAWASIRSVKWK
jgi:hypothetical protein